MSSKGDGEEQATATAAWGGEKIVNNLWRIHLSGARVDGVMTPCGEFFYWRERLHWAGLADESIFLPGGHDSGGTEHFVSGGGGRISG
jgi:hypothetical protein